MDEEIGDHDLPVTVAKRIQAIASGALPVVEVSYKVDPHRIGSPFAENPRTVSLTVKAVIQMIVDVIRKRSFRIPGYLPDSIGYPCMPRIDSLLEGHKIRVIVIYHH